LASKIGGAKIFLDPFVGEIVPSFQSVREKGLNMIDASQLHTIKRSPSEAMRASSGD